MTYVVTSHIRMSSEQHREFVRKQLRVILASGYSPMAFFTKDYKKYFYMAELLALVDLSLVSISGNKYATVSHMHRAFGAFTH